MCLAPLVLVGYLLTWQPNLGHTTTVDGGVVEAQSCETGVGVHAKAAQAGIYGAGLHYGMGTEIGPLRLTLQPFAGVSYADHPIRELPQRTQFEVGGSILVGYQKFRVAVEYWHLSNAGMTAPNIGLDTFAVMTGWQF